MTTEAWTLPSGRTLACVRLEGRPQAWKRPRATVRRKAGGGMAPSIYMDRGATEYQEALAQLLRASCDVEHPSRPGPYTGPVCVYVTAAYPAPGKGAAPWVRADLDRVVNAVGDALTRSGIVIDDAQIVEVEARKEVYTGKDAGQSRGYLRVHVATVSVTRSPGIALGALAGVAPSERAARLKAMEREHQRAQLQLSKPKRARK